MTQENGQRVSYGWVILATLWVSHVAYFLNYMTVGSLAPLIRTEFDLNSAEIGLLSSAISVGSALVQIPVGLMSDIWGAKWVMSAGLALIGVSAIAIVFVHSYVLFFCLLALMGFGIGCNQAPATKAVIMWFALRGRATAMGIKQAGVTIGGMLASFCLPRIALETNSWRHGFLAAGLLALVSAAFTVCCYREATSIERGPFRGLLDWKRDAVKLLLDKNFLLLCSGGILLMLVQYAFAAHFVMYATGYVGLPISAAGSFLSLSFFTAISGRILWGMSSDYLFKGRRRIILIIIAVSGAIVCGLFAVLGSSPSTYRLYALAVLFGLTGLSWNGIYLTSVGEFPHVALAGTATGLSFVIINLGAIAGPPLFGYVVDITNGYRLPWLLAGFCMSLAVVLTAIQTKERMVRN